jgi:hypothetical protein
VLCSQRASVTPWIVFVVIEEPAASAAPPWSYRLVVAAGDNLVGDELSVDSGAGYSIDIDFDERLHPFRERP